MKNKLTRQFNEISNFGSQYKYQELRSRIKLQEANMKRIIDLEKSILDLGD